MKRQQILERNDYDYEDRKFICAKSDNLCAHCGTPIQIGHNATVDHFIPLRKGGINQKINAIPLCKKCNQAKNSKIVAPDRYLRYLKPKYQKEIQDYYDSYIHSFEYVSRGNLLCCDQYTMKVYTGPKLSLKDKKKKQILYDKMSQAFILDRVYPKEMDELEDFFEGYLQKMDAFENRETVHKNIEFWKNFGVIYAIRDKNNEIKIMIPITIAKFGENEHDLNMYVFSRYATMTSVMLIYQLPYFLSRTIIEEQNLPYVRFRIAIIVTDPLSKYLEAGYMETPDSSFVVATNVYLANAGYDINTFSEKDNSFYQQFNDVKKYLDMFFDQEGYEDISEMGDIIIPGYSFTRKIEQLQKQQEKQRKIEELNKITKKHTTEEKS